MMHARVGYTNLVIAGVCAAIAAGFVALAQQAAAPQLAAPTVEPRMPAVQVVGMHSHIDQASFELIRDDKTWSAFWSRHADAPTGQGAIERHAAPKIDFTRFMVVCVLGGTRTNTDGITCEGVVFGDDVVRVRIEDSTFQTMAGFGEVDHGQPSTPYGFFVIERSELIVMIERGTRGLKNEPIVWKKAHEFAVP